MRRLFSRMSAVLAICIGVVPVWAAGTMHVSGEVSGIWPAGEVISVDGPIFVSAAKSLNIEAGVRIIFKITAPIIVEGRFEANGEASSPIVMEPLEGWAGFNFRGHGGDVRILRYVIISTQSGTPANVILGSNSLLDVEDCDFTAHYSCLNLEGGRIWAERNRIQTDYKFSKAIRLYQLLNDTPGWCSGSWGNHVTDNIVKIVAPPEDINPWETEFAAGLYVDGSTNTCLSGNVISVTAPGTAIGAFFGRRDLSGTDIVWQLEFCVITVRGLGLYTQGIEKANEGNLNVIRCSVDVGGTGAGFPPIGIQAAGGADVVVNSSLVQIDRGSAFFTTVSGGAMSVDYSDTWCVFGGSPPVPGGPTGRGNLLSKESLTENIVYGPHMYSLDPHLELNGEWGGWTTQDEVQAYYGLVFPSPCIDRGDTLFAGWDPDHTLPDIGRYYYRQEASTSPIRPSVQPANLVFSPVYPNPFNATTVIPFTLNKSGDVHIVVHNVLGQEVGTLISGRSASGSYRVPFNGTNLPSGLYVITVKLDGRPVASMKAMLLK